MMEIRGIKFKFIGKTIKLSEYFKIIKPKYIYLKITPDKSIRNYNSSNIIKTMTKMYKNIFKRIQRKNKHFSFHCEAKCSFFIDIRKSEVSFYLIVPDNYKNVFKEKLRETWGKVKIEEVSKIDGFSKEASMCQLYYKKEDALSLEVDKKSNEPLNSILSVLDIMEDKDHIGVFYNFIPRTQAGWSQQYKNTINKIKNKEPIDREVSLMYCLKMSGIVVTGLLDYILSVFSDLVGQDDKKNNLSFLEAAAEIINTNLVKISPSTTKKGNSSIIDAQIIAFSESDNFMRRLNNMLSLTGAYQSIAEDNELISKGYKLKKNTTFDFNKFRVPNAITNTTSIDECSRFIQIPGRGLLKEHDNIEQIKTLETKVPKDLQQGSKLLGVNEYRGAKVKAYLTTHKEYKNLALVIIGATRSGKTTFMGNIANDSIKANECVIYFDFIEDCQASERIIKCVGNNKTLTVDLSNYDTLEGLGYNEVFKEDCTAEERYDICKKQTNQLVYLINSVNVSSSVNSELSINMEDFLMAACMIGFSQQASIKNVFKILTDHNVRRKYIDNIPKDLANYMEEHVVILEQLDDYSKTKEKKLEGTKTHLIRGILTRISKLKKNTALEFMLKNNLNNNINLAEEFEKNQLIVIKLPESVFPSPEEKDIAVTYYLTKIWLAGQIRAANIRDRFQRKTVTVMFDEIAQLENAERFIGSKLDQTAKFGIKFILSAMEINQLKIKDILKRANTSYILIKGAEESNFKELKDKFNHYGYVLEDFLNLKPYQSLNYVKCDEGFSVFISRLPSEIK